MESQFNESLRDLENQKNVAELDLKSITEKVTNLRLDLKTHEINLDNANTKIKEAGLNIENIDYSKISGLSNEIRQKLELIRPKTFGKASRITCRSRLPRLKSDCLPTEKPCRLRLLMAPLPVLLRNCCGLNPPPPKCRGMGRTRRQHQPENGMLRCPRLIRSAIMRSGSALMMVTIPAFLAGLCYRITQRAGTA